MESPLLVDELLYLVIATFSHRPFEFVWSILPLQLAVGPLSIYDYTRLDRC